jgi:hypothetical protein
MAKDSQKAINWEIPTQMAIDSLTVKGWPILKVIRLQIRNPPRSDSRWLIRRHFLMPIQTEILTGFQKPKGLDSHFQTHFQMAIH